MSASALREKMQELVGVSAEIEIEPDGALSGEHIVSVRVWLPGRRRCIDMCGSIHAFALGDARQRDIFADGMARIVLGHAEDQANRRLGLPDRESRRRCESEMRRENRRLAVWP